MKPNTIPRSIATLLAFVLVPLPFAGRSLAQQDLTLQLGDKTEAPVAGSKIPTRYLDVATSVSNTAVAPGDRFSLVLEVEPHTNMHVYAPGAKGYRPISLSIEPNPLVRTLILEYPASEIYFFKALNERVPVFQKPFRLEQGLVLEAASAGKEVVTVKGTLEYQACDDTTCFLPVSVPLTWTVTLKAHLVH